MNGWNRMSGIVPPGIERKKPKKSTEEIEQQKRNGRNGTVGIGWNETDGLNRTDEIERKKTMSNGRNRTEEI
jgi:hypothetical protein